MLEVRCLHLFAQKLLINKPIEHGAALVAGELAQGAAVEQSFIAERVIPVTLQDNAAVDGGDDTVDDLAGPSRLHPEQSEHEGRSTESRNSLHNNLGQFHQNG